MFKFVLTNSIIREKMLEFLRPILCSPSSKVGYSINWVDGVYDDKEDIFITLIYYVPDGLAHCGTDFYQYIVIVGGNTVFSVTDNYDSKTGREFIVPSNYEDFSEIIKEGIKLYSNNQEKWLFEEKLEETGEISDQYYIYKKKINKQMYSQIIQ